MVRRYPSREEAGRRLARSVGHLRGADTVVLALPRGGLPVAREVARTLGAPLDVLVVRKLGVPWHPELAMGAIAEGGIQVLNDEVIRLAEISAESIDQVRAREHVELERRGALLRSGRERVALGGRTAVIVDDGMATGATAAVACTAARAAGAARVVLAVPIASPEAVRRVAQDADEVICPWAPAGYDSVGAGYSDFHQLSDDEAARILREST
ncbi:phosphoribosyltransferase [Rhodococcus sp. NPDC060090]|uniref:phosphoribosyltransferase n=1 Tax=Rhodococcus sp. NPDC060090 TaxID=3347056 RepID=UPI003666BE2E